MARSDPKKQPDTSSLRAPEGRRLYEQLEQLLRVYVQEHGLRPGDRLPSERVLAGALKVSRVSLRQATVSLEVQGLLEVRHGGGIYVRSLNVDPERLKTMLTLRRRLPDVLEAREAIECILARLAAQRRTDTDLAVIDASLRATILDTLRELNRNLGISLIYITHDLTTAYQISENIIVLYRGTVAEAGDVDLVVKTIRQSPDSDAARVDDELGDDRPRHPRLVQ